MQGALQSVIRLSISIALLSSVVSCSTTMNLRAEDSGDESQIAGGALSAG